jgi:hypothetical protein
MIRWLRPRWSGDPDATVIIGRKPPRSRWRVAASVLVVAVLVGAAAWLLVPRTRIVPAMVDLPTADEAALLDVHTTGMSLYRFAPAPAIVVAVFANLHAQAETLNRVAVFLEYAAAPRDRVLDDAQLRAMIAAGGVSFDSFYDGHDYRASDLARFFATADADGVKLDGAETGLRHALDALRQTPAAFGALISLPQGGADGLDGAARAAILRHELSHGLYFTDPAYAAMVTAWWRIMLTEDERAGFRRFLGAGHYDTTNDDLMRNEAQAYLIHTRNLRYFSPAAAGLSDTEAAALRAQFFAAMPADWLRDRSAP